MIRTIPEKEEPKQEQLTVEIKSFNGLVYMLIPTARAEGYYRGKPHIAYELEPGQAVSLGTSLVEHGGRIIAQEMLNGKQSSDETNNSCNTSGAGRDDTPPDNSGG